MHGWGLLQLLVIINYLVLFIEYAYQTFVVCPMLYRYHLIVLLYSLFYCYIVLCVYITHCIHILNHCNDLALNGSLIGNKHICILYCIYFLYIQVSFYLWLKLRTLERLINLFCTT